MHCTVVELQDRISYAEFTEWLAFMAVEPVGDRRADLHFAMLATLIANINRDPKQRSQAYKIDDFLIDFWEDRPEPLLLDKFKAMAQSINVRNSGD